GAKALPSVERKPVAKAPAAKGAAVPAKRPLGSGAKPAVGARPAPRKPLPPDSEEELDAEGDGSAEEMDAEGTPKSKKMLFIGIGAGALVLIGALAFFLKGGGDAAAPVEEAATERKTNPILVAREKSEKFWLSAQA